MTIVGKGTIAALAFLMTCTVFGQSGAIKDIRNNIAQKQKEIEALEAQLETLQIEEYAAELRELGLPALNDGETVVEHALMSLVYEEEHEQPKWVAHYLAPEVKDGNVSRTNDFRVDDKIATGSSEEADYFLKTEVNGEWEYDGYGYDRGHLAPSADFRWSERALSESYFYSNMSPQLPGFNREGWADLENHLRGYLYRNENSHLLVVTGPVYMSEVKKSPRSPNGLSIPDAFFKVAYDPDHQRAVAFLVPHQEDLAPMETYMISVDSLETLTNIDFYPALDDALENSVEAYADPGDWMPELVQGDVLPIHPPSLPKGHFNTVQAKLYMDSGDQIKVCGTVVSTKKTRNGHVFLNLDKRYPNQIFTVTIWKDDLLNFSYDPSEALEGKQVCITGKVSDFDGVPSMNINNEKAIEPYR